MSRQSINEQLNIRVPNNPNIPSKYARGLATVQPQLGSEDWSLDFYNDSAALSNPSNADGEDEYSSYLGVGYPFCVRDICRKCKSKCKDEKGLKWHKGGRSCHKECVGEWRDSGKPAPSSMGNAAAAAEAAAKEAAAIQSANLDASKTGMSTGAKVGIAVGVLAVLGVVGYLIIRKK